MKISSRVMSIVLVAALLMTGLCVSAFAASGPTFVDDASAVLCEGLPCYEVGSSFKVKVSSDAAPLDPAAGARYCKNVALYADALAGTPLGTYTGTDVPVDITPVTYGKNTIYSFYEISTYSDAGIWEDGVAEVGSSLEYYAVKKVADAADNKIEGITEPTYKRYLDITFTAVGDGMDNDAPVKGDTRYAPVKYSANLDEHKFAEGIYSGTYSHNGTGIKTLVVTFELEQFDGTSWVKTGITDEKEVSYESVSNGSYVELIMAIFVLLDSLLAMITGGAE
ncbi:MAG: hypothetical protein GX051_02895 [Clostridiales bacterium]|nr:hypothetical protein [Clostridiales bacterium]